MPTWSPLVITNPSCGKVQACLVVHKVPRPRSQRTSREPASASRRDQSPLHHVSEVPPRQRGHRPGRLPRQAVARGSRPMRCSTRSSPGRRRRRWWTSRTGRATWLTEKDLPTVAQVLSQSVELPAAVVVCRKGALTPAQVAKVRDGLVNCNKTAIGRAFTMFWQLDGFKDVTPDYGALDRTLKEYPRPGCPRRRCPCPAHMMPK